jgi:ABC-type multidrug transport system ATPase subunit
MIRVEHLTKKFGQFTAAADINLSLARGESLALWGSNGAGKTTIIRCVLGLLSFQGTIRVGGRDVARDGKRARSLIGYVPQELAFYDDLRVWEAITLFASLKNVVRVDLDATLDHVGIPGQGGKRIRELSGGMKQRLALAIALLGDPPLLVLDEVTASLDVCGRAELVALLGRLSGQGRSLLFASHRADEVTSLAQRVIMIDRGRVTAEVPVSQFVANLGVGSVLHLHMPELTRPPAVRLLREHGFNATLNGVGVLVPVPATQKAVPLRLLAEARLSVDDFELLSSPDASPSRENRA